VTHLFSGENLTDRLRSELRQAVGIVEGLDPDALLDPTGDEVVAAVLQRRLVPPLLVLWESASSSAVGETKLDVQHDFRYGGAGRGRPVYANAAEVTVSVPFTGDRTLFEVRPLNLLLADRGVRVGSHDELVIRMAHPEFTAQKIRSKFDGIRAAVERTLTTVNATIDAHNRELEQQLHRLVAARRERLLANRRLTAVLPFDVRPTGVQPTYTVPVRRRRIHLIQPRTATPFQPQPALENATYEDILERIAEAARQLERTPSTVQVLGEEDLRNLLLVSLNMVYEGQAGAEVFSRSGKTDITVTVGDRHLFVAECKIWDGPKKFTDGIDQLLSYLVCRDSKAALILFIRQGQATSIIEKADAAVTAHAQLERRFDPVDPASRIEYLLRSTADDRRRIRTALLPVVIDGPRPAEAEEDA
jgi:hypothetical protein